MKSTLSNAHLSDIAEALKRIANALEEQNKPKGLGYAWSQYGIANAVGNQDTPLPKIDSSTPYCNSDVLYKSPEKPNWYNIKDTNFPKENLENELYG